ncbi:hypothetical protein B0T19DRAFT_115237 [Cercophora scortea]|uniref:Uncharacterized protein n=1 Tax=Cercophora scortea TaxID=314031 RepID=A0AAE0IXJ2_9PEZI|nr:hypothetical protein B0T19DRAFT_115237 [Cercophora scortea]
MISHAVVGAAEGRHEPADVLGHHAQQPKPEPIASSSTTSTSLLPSSPYLHIQRRSPRSYRQPLVRVVVAVAVVAVGQFVPSIISPCRRCMQAIGNQRARPQPKTLKSLEIGLGTKLSAASKIAASKFSHFPILPSSSPSLSQDPMQRKFPVVACSSPDFLTSWHLDPRHPLDPIGPACRSGGLHCAIFDF